jgi:hypothetical protein
MMLSMQYPYAYPGMAILQQNRGMQFDYAGAVPVKECKIRIEINTIDI